MSKPLKKFETEAELRAACAEKIRQAVDYLTELAAEVDGVTSIDHLCRRLGYQRDEIAMVIVTLRNHQGWK